MNGHSRSAIWDRIRLLLLCIAVMIFPITGQAQTFPNGLSMTVAGPDGSPRSHVGETITAVIRMRNTDDFNDSLLITNIQDIIHHTSGGVTTPNLLPLSVTL